MLSRARRQSPAEGGIDMLLSIAQRRTITQGRKEVHGNYIHGIDQQCVMNVLTIEARNGFAWE